MTEKEYIIYHIKKNYEKKTINEMATILDIKEGKVRGICTKLGLKPITEAARKVRFVKKNINNMTNIELAQRLKMTVSGVKCIIDKEGLIRKETIQDIHNRTKIAIGVLDDILVVSGTNETDDQELIRLAKRALAYPGEYNELQLLVATNVKRKNPQYF